MLRLIQLLLLGHTHTWVEVDKKYRQVIRKNEYGHVALDTNWIEYHLRCSKCGKMKFVNSPSLL